jgi:low affinity Fe/Cu permease
MGKGNSQTDSLLQRFAHHATAWSGSSWAFIVAVAVIVLWAATGPLFDYSDTWQLVINTSTTIITFLMVFLIQRAQNKESMAVQLKLSEIVAALEGASNRMIGVENLSEAEIELLHKHYERLVAMARQDANLTKSHSIEEAESGKTANSGSRGRKKPSGNDSQS